MSNPVTLDLRDSNKSPIHIHLVEDMPVHVHVKREKDRKNVRRKTPSVRFGSGILKTESGFKSDSGLASDSSRLNSRYRQGRSPISRRTRPGLQTGGSKGLSSTRNKLDRSSSERVRDSNTTSVKLVPQDIASDYEDYSRLEKGQRTSSLRRSNSRSSMVDTYRQLEDEMKELDDINTDIKLADTVNRSLRRSVEALNRSDADNLFSSTQNDKVQRKLLEIEMESQAIANQVSALADALKFLKEDRRIAVGDSTILMKHKDLLEDRLERFRAGSNALRKLMTYQQDQDVIALRLAEQRDKLLERLAKTQNSQQDVLSQLLEKDEEIVDLKMQLEAQKEEYIAVQGLHSSVSSTKAHLQKQLKQKDADCNRLSVQIRTLESQLAQERIDVEHLRSLLVQARKKPDQDKEALKKATRVQKLRAARSEDALEQMKASVQEKDQSIEELKIDLEALQSHNNKLNREKEHALSDVTALKQRLNELESLMERQDDRSRKQVATVNTRLEEKSTELIALRRDNDKLRSMCASADSKMAHKEDELAELKTNLKEYQTLIEEYRSQLEDQRRETRRVRQESDAELDNIEKQGDMLTESRANVQQSENDAKYATGKLASTERRLSQLEDENRDLIGSNAKREEAVRQMSARLDEKMKDNASLQRQLDSASSELRRLKELERERSSTTERTLQTKILELESQIGQLKSEISKLKREKDENERKFNSKVYDLKDRLEQSHSTNRSMQNYVQFLKNSYTSAFNDVALGPTTSTPLRAALY